MSDPKIVLAFDAAAAALHLIPHNPTFAAFGAASAVAELAARAATIAGRAATVAKRAHTAKAAPVYGNDAPDIAHAADFRPRRTRHRRHCVHRAICIQSATRHPLVPRAGRRMRSRDTAGTRRHRSRKSRILRLHNLPLLLPLLATPPNHLPHRSANRTIPVLAFAIMGQ